MTVTSQLQLPLLQAAQAQKHVTVNEALARLDAMANLRILSKSLTAPPTNPIDGDTYHIPTGGVNEWDSQDDNLAIYANGGWVFLTPQIGWKAWIVDEGLHAIFDTRYWRNHSVAVSPGGAATLNKIVEFDHSFVAGATNLSLVPIQSGDHVIGITARVMTAITGTGLTGWDLGVTGNPTLYGNGLSIAYKAKLIGPNHSADIYWADTPLLLTALGGNFDGGGIVRIAMHMTSLAPPRAP